ncbi:MAG: apolipoprotein N-acyltransferase [Rhodospirillaceae bacterium]|nr:apolipoprotein N-acyltransferase [Rhodospirillaceae bacterium]|tara:strand:+ start:560 stop:1885 length:1326 start_codon:yes stop_codon:yes gene_type:complete
MAYPMLVDPAENAWLIPFAIFILPAFLSMFVGLVTLITKHLSKNSVQLVFIFPVFWVFFEWLRGNILTGFPWNLIGYTFSDFLTISQIASVVGIYGLSFFAIFFACSFSLVGSKKKQNLVIPILGIAILFTLHFFGSYKLDNSINHYKNIKLRLVQPNIVQNEKWKESLKYKNFMKHYSLSKYEDFNEIDLFIWPETALTYTSINEILNKDSIYDLLRNDAMLITGMPRIIFNEYNPEKFKLYNSVVILNEKLDIVDSYNKFHLVPFGEYLPFRNLFDYFGFSKIVFGPIDYSRGGGPKTIKFDNFPSFSPLICFEAIFPGEVVNSKVRPEWMLSLSNDAWFGNFAGPQQHFEMARIRTIEEGLPLIRVSNTGISAVIDSYGRVLKSLPYGKFGIIDHFLPGNLQSTIYSRFGDILVFTLGIFLISSIFLFQAIKKIFNNQ